MLIYILLASASAFTLSSINVALMGSNDHSCNVASDLPAIAVSMVLDLPCGACVDVSTPSGNLIVQVSHLIATVYLS